jgi:hypothetical protein
MEHLSLETLARLVDEAPTPEERRHLDECPTCDRELEALRDQTTGLSHLPDLRPPREGWADLERKLRSEGLIGSGARPAGAGGGDPGGHRGSPWLQAAAGVALLLAGAGMGMGAGSLMDGPDGAPPPFSAADPLPSSVVAVLDQDPGASDLTLEEAEALVRLTEDWYRSALVRYREQLAREGEPFQGEANPVTRYAALETLLAASRAAVRESPTDPFLNGLLVNMTAERDATLRGIRASAPGENWY